MTDKNQPKDQVKQLPKCKHCGREFIPRSAWQKFCTDNCRIAAWMEANKPPRKAAAK